MSKSKVKKGKSARLPAGHIHYDHTAKGLTSYAGMIPVLRFLEKTLCFTQLFQKVVDHERAINATYALVDVVFMVIVGHIGGAFSLRKCVHLWADPVLRRIAGWVQVPDDSTLGRVLKDISERHINALETLVHTCRDRVWELALHSGASKVALHCVHWVDGDSTVKTVFGHQEGATKGYNPKNKGKLSFHRAPAKSDSYPVPLRPSKRNGSSRRRLKYRFATAMHLAPARRSKLMERLRIPAMTCGALPVRICERSSS